MSTELPGILKQTVSESRIICFVSMIKIYEQTSANAATSPHTNTLNWLARQALKHDLKPIIMRVC